MPHPLWGSPEYDIHLPHNSGALPKLRGSASEPTLKKSCRCPVPKIVQNGGVGRYRCESLGPGRFRWAPVEARVEVPKNPNYSMASNPRELHADNRPSRQSHPSNTEAVDPATAAMDGVARSLGYCPGGLRRQKQASRLGDMIPASWRAYGENTTPDLQTDGIPMIVCKSSIMEIARSSTDPNHPHFKHDDPSKPPKRCKITTFPEMRVLTFKPRGERLLVKRWQPGYCLMTPSQLKQPVKAELKSPFKTRPPDDGADCQDPSTPTRVGQNVQPERWPTPLGGDDWTPLIYHGDVSSGSARFGLAQGQSPPKSPSSP